MAHAIRLVVWLKHVNLLLLLFLACINWVVEQQEENHAYMSMQVTESSKVGSFKRPSKLIEIYEFEGCPFCRKVKVNAPLQNVLA